MGSVLTLAGVLLMMGAGPGLTAAPVAAPTEAAGLDWPQWGGSDGKNMVSPVTGLVAWFDRNAGTNLRWKAPLGTQTYGSPVIRVIPGTPYLMPAFFPRGISSPTHAPPSPVCSALDHHPASTSTPSTLPPG